MKTWWNNWSVMRVLRLVLGVVAVVQSFHQRDMALALLGIFLLLTAIANVGSCGANGCAIDFRRNKSEKESL